MRYAIAGVLASLLAAVICAAPGDDVPEPYRKLKNPLKPAKETLALARDLYERSCVSCHGPEGKGDGEEVRRNQSKDRPADFTRARFLKYSDQKLIWRISEGVPRTAMYGYKAVYPEKERWALVLLVRSFFKKTANQKK